MKIIKSSVQFTRVSIPLCVVLTLGLLMLSGCAAVPKPPAPLPRWSTARSSTGTPDITGCYQATGVGYDKVGKNLGQFSLISVLRSMEPGTFSNDGCVVVKNPKNGDLEFQSATGWASFSHFHENIFTGAKGYQSCYENVGKYIRLRLLLNTEAGPLLLVFENSAFKLYLRKAADGGLIVCSQDSVEGEIFFVPFYVNHAKWYYFKPANTNAVHG
jgi:hypothetical protein